MKNPIIMVIIAAIVAAGVGFVGGLQYQKTQASTAGNQNTFQNGIAGQNGARRFGNGQPNPNARGVRGQIVSVDPTGITVKLADGSTKIILISSTTAIMQETTVSSGDLANGKEVLVLGTTNSDGSVTAQTIQLNPQAMRFGGATGSAQPQPNPAPPVY